MPNHEKQQTKVLAQDLYTSSNSKSWYGLESLFKELPTSSFCPPETSFYAPFYIKNVLLIVKRNGKRLILLDFTFQQDDAKPHTSGNSIEKIESIGVSLIVADILPPNSLDLNPLDYFFGTQSKYS